IEDVGLAAVEDIGAPHNSPPVESSALPVESSTLLEEVSTVFEEVSTLSVCVAFLLPIIDRLFSL
ncbi:hypothetical protein DXG01_012408, partial [Tephrocybe rancida]